ncbi:hypothetical protein BD769DRAFT_56606 [Suillus cothurnatus]|nr:hypothetical protein BD769DRAFT_56606 [Suillus cothurnatus]
MVKSCNIYTIPRTIQNLTFETGMDQQTSMVTAVPPSTSSSQLGHVSDRNVMKTILQSCLKCLDRHNDKIINISSEMLEIRTCFMELLDNVQAEATVIDSATGDYSAYLQETFSDEPQNIATVAPDEPNAMSPPLTVLDVLDLPQPLANDGLLDQGYGSSRSVGVMGSLPEDTNPMIFQRSPDCVNYELGEQTFVPQHGPRSEGETLPGSSSRLDPQSSLPTVQGNQDKVKCTWPGCSKFVKKWSRTRHVNETHLQKVRAVCESCGRGFTRLYMKKDHVCKSS